MASAGPVAVAPHHVCVYMREREKVIVRGRKLDT